MGIGHQLVVLAPDDSIPTGTLWMDVHHPAVNRLTLSAVDPKSNEPNYKQCAVRFVSPETTSTVTRGGIRHDTPVDDD
jgi:assimilatory nitrate reductase catalytic subunit